MRLFLMNEVQFKSLFILTFANVRFMLTGAKTKGFTPFAEEEYNFGNYQNLSEKKIYFTSNSAQYLKFGVKLPCLLDFAMCLWYKPEVILEHNILFAYGSKTQQLILWKIKKKQNKPVIILKVYNTVIMEESIDGLIVGQWHHLCQYWQGSTGLWALFFNSYIVSFGYTNMTKYRNWYINNENATATINQPTTSKTLHGEVYGFYLMSMKLLQDSNNYPGEAASVDTNETVDYFSTGKKLNIMKVENSKIRRRQTTPIRALRRKRRPEGVPAGLVLMPERRTPLFVVGRFLTFARQMVSFVTVPVFRFVRGLIVPWRKPFTSETKPTTRKPSTSSTTRNTTQSAVTRNSTTTGAYSNNTSVSNSTSNNQTDFTKLEESFTIYETDSNIVELGLLRNVRNGANGMKKLYQSTTVRDIDNVMFQPAQTKRVQPLYYASANENQFVADKCSVIETKFIENVQKSKYYEKNGYTKFVTTSTENTTDAITRLGASLQFMHFLYMCCRFRHEELLISWDETLIFVNNVVVEQSAGCGSF